MSGLTLEALLRLDDGRICDYHTLRDRVFDEAIHYYGAAGGGPWTGYQGLPTLFLSLAAVGNIVALCNYEGLIPNGLTERVLKDLQEVHVALKKFDDPFS